MILVLAIFHIKVTILLVMSLIVHLLLNFFILFVNVNKLFKQWDSSVWVLFTLRDHMTRQKLYNFTKCHLLVIVWINLMEKELNLIFIINNIHLFNEHAEFIFGNASILIGVNFLVYFSEFKEEALVLLKLEVKNYFLELSVLQLSIVSI